MKPVILSLSGTQLTASERDLFRDAQPAGYILFGRNIADAQQLRALTDSLRDLEGRDDVAILIDQEGGRVARMKPPSWPEFPAPGAFDRLYDRAPASAIEAARVNAAALGVMLAEAGITVNCLPLLDVRQPDADPIMGDRCFGSDPMRVAALGRAVLDGLAAAGVVGVVKHIPGHGRATCDSHKALPVVTADAAALEADLEPFRTLKAAPMAMTAHVVYTAWDADRPASLSPAVIGDVIRQDIDFQGFLMSDDLDMQALDGDIPSRAVRAVAAGCDAALYCWADMAMMQPLVAALPDMPAENRFRLDTAMANVRHVRTIPPFTELAAKRDALLALAG